MRDENKLRLALTILKIISFYSVTQPAAIELVNSIEAVGLALSKSVNASRIGNNRSKSVKFSVPQLAVVSMTKELFFSFRAKADDSHRKCGTQRRCVPHKKWRRTFDNQLSRPRHASK